MEALVADIAPDDLRKQANESFGDLDDSALTQDNFLDLVSACGRRCIAKCPNSLPAVEVEGFVMEMAAQLWSQRNLQGRCPLRELLSQLRVSSEFGPRECAFMTKYFYYFGKCRSHEGMMNDIGRTETYRQAIHGNPDDFKDKVVMDVGSGSGLLAFFAIQAGAKKVYAIEAGCMHEVIGMLARANGWGDKVVVVNKVLQDMTEADCPLNSVDTMIAETLGTFLFGERGIETMLVARDRFLKKGGAIFPTRATLSMAPFSDLRLFKEQSTRPQFWTGTDFYGIDISCVHARAYQEQMSQVVASMVDPATLVAKQHDTLYDFRTIDSAALRNIPVPYSFECERDSAVHGIAGWFVAEFVGSNETTTLSTAPFDTCTHWWQVRFMILKPLETKKGDIVTGQMNLQANEQQSYTCSLEMILGSERRENSDMGLMDLDGSLKQYSYKVVTHGNIQVACVDWKQTTEEAMRVRSGAGQSAKKFDARLGEQITIDGLEFICVDAPERQRDLKLKNTVVVGKVGESMIHGAVGELKHGLIRRETSGEESFWMERNDYFAYMIDHIIAKKQYLQGDFKLKPDDEIRAHFHRLALGQVKECHEALKGC